MLDVRPTQVPTFGYSSPLTSQTFNAAWCLTGLCFLVSGFLGVRYKLEPHARLFLYYLIVTFIIDSVYMVAPAGCRRIVSRRSLSQLESAGTPVCAVCGASPE